MKKKYKVKLYAKWFEEPTSLTCENVISCCYLYAANPTEVKERIQKRFGGRKEIIDIIKIN